MHQAHSAQPLDLLELTRGGLGLGQVDDLRGTPMSVGNLEEIIDDSHAIVSSSVGPEYYVNILSFVDKGQLEPGCSVLMHNKALSIVGTLSDEADPMVSVMKVDKAPLESYADVGGLETQVCDPSLSPTQLPSHAPFVAADANLVEPRIGSIAGTRSFTTPS